MFTAVLFATAKTCKKPRCPSVGGQTNYDTLKGILLLFRCQVMPDSFVTPWTGRPPGSSVCGISQARILEWAAVSSFRGSSRYTQSHFCYSKYDTYVILIITPLYVFGLSDPLTNDIQE